MHRKMSEAIKQNFSVELSQTHKKGNKTQSNNNKKTLL